MQNYIGKQIDRYRIIERLGMGGMAVVYKAFDTRLERDVALKLIRVDEIPASQHERLMKRFEREAKAMAKFSHPNIVPVYDYGEVDGSPYLVMEYIPGGTLKERITKPIPYQQAVRWLTPVADALRYAHAQKVIHRDVKPSNILFDSEGRPLLTDFGIAKVLETDEATLTGTGLGVGTPEYMAPEQWRGIASEATDQYALGIVLYELLTGRKPYTADTPAAIAVMQATEPLPRPGKLVDGIPEEVEKVLYKTLARDSQDRYESVSALKKALENINTRNDKSPGEENIETFTYAADETLGEKHSAISSLSASEIEHIELQAYPLELHNELELDGETFDALDSTPSDEMKIPGEVLDDFNKVQKGYPLDIHPKGSSKTTSTKFLTIGIPAVIGVIVGICVIIASAIAIMSFVNNNNADEQALTSARQTSTAEAIATETAQIQATATAEVKASQMASTATSEALFEFFYSTANNENIMFEDSFSLDHDSEDGKVEMKWLHIDLENFAIEINSINPYDSSVSDWDYGIIFRDTSENDYRLVLYSWQYWVLYDSSWESIQEGSVSLNLGEGNSNEMKFIADNDVGYLFINDLFVSSLDLSELLASGNIGIGTGFNAGNEVDGYSTSFENVTIYSNQTNEGNSSVDGEDSNVKLSIEDEDGMKYIRVVDETESIDYRVGPVASSSAAGLVGPLLSANEKCFAYLLLPKVYYCVIGDDGIYVAGDVSHFTMYQKSGGWFLLEWRGNSYISINENITGETDQFFISDCY